MYLVKKTLNHFPAAHRLVKSYQGKCNNLHGHNYVVKIELSRSSLNDVGFVIDFDEVERCCNQWIVQHLDHSVICCSEDQPLIAFCQQHNQKHYILPDAQNSTAEAIAAHLFDIFDTDIKRKDSCLTLMAVEVWESHDAGAIFSPSS